MEVEAGGGLNCGMRSDGSVSCWGNDDMVACNPDGETFTKMNVAGDQLASGLRADGTLRVWGTEETYMDDVIEEYTGNYKDMEIFGWANCVIKMDDSLHCEGSNHMNWVDEENDYQDVSMVLGQICALTIDREMSCMFEYEDGIEMPTGTFEKVIAGMHHSCALNTSGGIECWGDDEFGQSTFGVSDTYEGEFETLPESGNVCVDTEPNDVSYDDGYPPWEQAQDCVEMANGDGFADTISGALDPMEPGWYDGDIDVYRFVVGEGGDIVGSLEWDSAYIGLDWMLYCYCESEVFPWGLYKVSDPTETEAYDKPAQGRSVVDIETGSECYLTVMSAWGETMTEYTLSLWTEP